MSARLAILTSMLSVFATIAGCVDHPQIPTRIEPPPTTVPSVDRLAWWHEAKFGLFIHWGLYSVPAGTYDGKRVDLLGEWIMNDASIPVATYAQYADEFNPTKFNADQWVSLAKAAGMKYIIITAKHHDGFAMFKSRVSRFNIVDATPFMRDPIQELADACHKQGMRFGVYYSQSQDWSHHGGKADAHAGRTTDHWDRAQNGSFDRYLQNLTIPQVKELLLNYGQIDVLWWDTPKDITHDQAAKLHALLKYQPNIITNNRLGGGFTGDTETPEQEIPVNGFPDGRNWETCMTINDTWGYKSYDTNFKSTKVLLQDLIDIASKGGNYLLNVGPDATGTIPPPEADRLREIGQWLSINGESIYGSTASPFAKQPAWGRVTQKPGKLYLHVFNWPTTGELIVPMKGAVTKAYLLAAPTKTLTVINTPAGLSIDLPPVAPDSVASVIAVEIEGSIQPIVQQ